MKPGTIAWPGITKVGPIAIETLKALVGPIFIDGLHR